MRFYVAAKLATADALEGCVRHGLSQYPEEGTPFNDAMASSTSQLSAMVAKPRGFLRFGTDVGGGNATLILSLLEAHPKLKGMIFDLPCVAAEASKRIVIEGTRV